MGNTPDKNSCVNIIHALVKNITSGCALMSNKAFLYQVKARLMGTVRIFSGTMMGSLLFIGSLLNSNPLHFSRVHHAAQFKDALKMGRVFGREHLRFTGSIVVI